MRPPASSDKTEPQFSPSPKERKRKNYLNRVIEKLGHHMQEA